jgi:hypothetical protein
MDYMRKTLYITEKRKQIHQNKFGDVVNTHVYYYEKNGTKPMNISPKR